MQPTGNRGSRFDTNAGARVVSLGATVLAPRTEAGPAVSRRAARLSGRRRFRFIERLGSGSQGVVYLARDLSRSAELTALKIAWANETARDSVLREAEILRDLDGASATPEFLGTLRRSGESIGFAMGYEEGATLDRYVALRGTHGRLRSAELTRVSIAIVRCVLEVLEHGFLHCDIKPSHLYVRLGGDRVRLLDFGLARRVDCRVAPEISGTLTYASPEQLAAGPLDERSDLFALGVVLHELATGRPFFTTEERMTWQRLLEVRSRRLRHEVALSGVDRRLARLVRRLLVVDPALRAGSAEVAARLDELHRAA